mmetsp:Transcript_10787/g.22486  ORF Transcript_10787/g.22486 Transcript_10787/m.22486 type:complete len:212 (-) Transcript_10787:102-737(-)
MHSCACGSPALRSDRNARSLYCDAHTDLSAAKAGSQWASPSAQGTPLAAASAFSAACSCGGAPSAITSSMHRLSCPSRSLSTAAYAFSSSSRTALFAGMFSTSSKVEKGTAMEGGRPIQSGSLPRRLARFLDLAPTTPGAKASMPTAYSPHHLGFFMATAPFVRAAPAACFTAPLALPAAASWKETSPPVESLAVMYCPLRPRHWSSRSAS